MTYRELRELMIRQGETELEGRAPVQLLEKARSILHESALRIMQHGDLPGVKDRIERELGCPIEMTYQDGTVTVTILPWEMNHITVRVEV